MLKADAPDVYEYLDYRAYLRAYYKHHKARGRGFSYRAFSKKAGLSSPNHLKRVIDGERNLSREMTMRFAAACELSAQQSAYFLKLVAFAQARSTQESRSHYESLQSDRGYQKVQTLDAAHSAYHSDWYIPAIRELAQSRGFRDDAAWIAKRLLPVISEAEARRALEILLRLGLLTRDEDGRLVQSESVVSTGPETRGVHIVSYHQTMMAHAIKAVDLVQRTDRDLSALTLCLSHQGLEQLKVRLQEFRKELVGLEGADGRGRLVVQVNMQMFPLTQVADEEDSCDSL